MLFLPFCIEMELASFLMPLIVYGSQLYQKMQVHWDMEYFAVFQSLEGCLPFVLHIKNYSFGRQVTGNCWTRGTVNLLHPDTSTHICLNFFSRMLICLVLSVPELACNHCWSRHCTFWQKHIQSQTDISWKEAKDTT